MSKIDAVRRKIYAPIMKRDIPTEVFYDGGIHQKKEVRDYD